MRQEEQLDVATNMISRLILGCLVLIPSAATQPAVYGKPPSRTPNVVFILVDDLGWTDLGCFGSSFYETPHIDRLATTGMRFRSAYAACQVCSPTRASLISGVYPQRLGITDYISPNGGNQPGQWKRKTKLLPAPYQDRMKLEQLTLAERLRDHGYATFFAGKWHLGPEGFWPEDQGFDINRGGIAIGGPYGGKKYFSPYDNPRLTDGPTGEHLPDRLASETADFIKAQRDVPFLAYLSFYSVHTPLMARPDLLEKYRELKSRIRIAGPLWGKEGQRKVRLVQEHAVYAGMVEAMDQAVGKVLQALHDAGVADNTIVILTSDNGGLSTSEGHPTSNLPLRGGKGWMYEGGIRVPLIIRAPGVTKPNSQSDQYVTSPDFVPTILELIGQPAPQPYESDGVSFAKVLQGESIERGPVFWHYPHYGNQGGAPTSAVREGDWKLIHWLEDDRFELFNLSQDLSETRDRSQDQSARVASLKEKLDRWKVDVGAKSPTPRR